MSIHAVHVSGGAKLQEGQVLTYCEPPGNFVQASLLSLYRRNAALTLGCCSNEGSESDVSAFIELTTSLSSPGGAPSMKDEITSADAISWKLCAAERREVGSTWMVCRGFWAIAALTLRGLTKVQYCY